MKLFAEDISNGKGGVFAIGLSIQTRAPQEIAVFVWRWALGVRWR